MLKRVLFSVGLCLGFFARANIDGQDWIFHHEGRDVRFKWKGHARGTPLVPLEELTKAFGLETKFDPKTFEVTVTNPKSGSRVRFYTFSRWVEGRLKSAASITGFSMELSKAPRFEGLKLCVPIDFGDRALRPLLTGVRPSNPLVRKSSDALVMIDPGHGGNDYGTSFSNGNIVTHEKDLVLTLAWELKKALAAKNITSSLTREDDSFLTLPERTRLANTQGAKLFISLHLNADPKDKSHGFEIYVLSLVRTDEDARWAVAAENQMIPDDVSEGVDRALGELRAEANFEKSLHWAKLFSQSLQTSNWPMSVKPVRSGPFYVLYGAEMPALLLELGYLTGAGDRAAILNAEKRQVIMTGLADAVAKELAKQLTNDSKKP